MFTSSPIGRIIATRKKAVPTAIHFAVITSRVIKMLLCRGEMEIPVSEYGKAKRLCQCAGRLVHTARTILFTDSYKIPKHVVRYFTARI